MATRRAIAWVTLLMLGQAAAPMARQAPLEYEVKAAFLLNFGRYVQWPSPPSDRFHLCLLGANPFGTRLETIVAGEMWHDKAIDIRRIQDLREARSCHVLYVPASATEQFLAAGPASLHSVLTVGETRDFLLQGGMIHLFVEQNKVRFSINQAAAETSGLQISSRLLRLAREVVAQPPVP
jgi:hypothetical protein